MISISLIKHYTDEHICSLYRRLDRHVASSVYVMWYPHARLKFGYSVLSPFIRMESIFFRIIWMQSYRCIIVRPCLNALTQNYWYWCTQNKVHMINKTTTINWLIQLTLGHKTCSITTWTLKWCGSIQKKFLAKVWWAIWSIKTIFPM
jgi:hypothetical protein